MNIVKYINQYDDKYVYLCDPIKNNIINEGNFVRIIYSTDNVIFNGIYILIKLNEVTCDKYFNKYKYNFNIYTHLDIITKIQKIEQQILHKFGICNKIIQFKLYDQLKSGNIKIFDGVLDKSNVTLILKISGIWESQHAYGLTFKFLNCI